MKILVLNGSPRKGNTVTAIHAFAEGAKDKNEIEVIDTYKSYYASGKEDLAGNAEALAELKAEGERI